MSPGNHREPTHSEQSCACNNAMNLNHRSAPFVASCFGRVLSDIGGLPAGLTCEVNCSGDARTILPITPVFNQEAIVKPAFLYYACAFFRKDAESREFRRSSSLRGQFERMECAVYRSPQPGMTPLYGYYNDANKDHFTRLTTVTFVEIETGDSMGS